MLRGSLPARPYRAGHPSAALVQSQLGLSSLLWGQCAFYPHSNLLRYLLIDNLRDANAMLF